MSIITALCGWMSRFCSCNNNYCCLMTVAPPTDSIGLSRGIYMLNMVFLLLSLPSSVINAHLPRPEGPSPLLIVAEVSLFKDIIVVPPGLQSEFYDMFDSDVHVPILSSGRVSFIIFFKLLVTWGRFQCTFVSVKLIMPTPTSRKCWHNCSKK